MMKNRFLREESGFTLPELLVTMIIMVTVLFALYSIFDMSIKMFSFSNDKTEAVENARIGLEKMERELRAAYPVNKAANPSQNYRFWNPGSLSTGVIPPAGSQITFGNDLNGDRLIDSNEEITYKLSSSGPPYALQRVRNGSADPVVEFVGKFSDGTPGLKFTPLTSVGSAPTSEAQVARVKIDLVIDKNGRTQTLTTDVALRNPGG